MQNPVSPAPPTRGARDWTGQLSGKLIWWIIPAVIASSASSLELSPGHMGFVWAAAFAWMGTGCVLNAWRCSRLHCFFSGPALWAGAIGSLLVGLRVLSGAHDLNDVILGTVVLFVMSYLPEAFWGKYARRGEGGSAAGR